MARLGNLTRRIDGKPAKTAAPQRGRRKKGAQRIAAAKRETRRDHRQPSHRLDLQFKADSSSAVDSLGFTYERFDWADVSAREYELKKANETPASAKTANTPPPRNVVDPTSDQVRDDGEISTRIVETATAIVSGGGPANRTRSRKKLTPQRVEPTAK